MPSRSAARTSGQVARFSRGMSWRSACTHEITISPNASSSPGPTPAMNRRAIDCSAITPQMTAAIDGGISGPSTPALTASAVANALS